MRVLFIATLYPPYIVGGAEVSTKILAESLVRRGIDVGVITTSLNNQKSLVVNGVKVFYVTNRNVYWKYPSKDRTLFMSITYHTIDVCNVLYQNDISSIIKSFKPDVVHTHNLCGISTFAWEIVKRLHVPLVHSLRDYYLMCPKQTMFDGSKNCSSQCAICKIYSRPKRKFSDRVSAVVGISGYILDKHIKQGYFKNTKEALIIPNSIARVKSLKSKESKAVGYIGRLSPEKGIELLIKAFCVLGNPCWRLVIAGTGNKSYVEFLKENYAESNINFLGQVEQANFFNQVDLVVVPSLWHEPFGRVVVEAFSYGIPVFVSDRGGLPELIKDYLGRVFRVDCVSHLSELLSSFFKGELVFDSERISSEASQLYKESVVAVKHEMLYKKLLNLKSDESCDYS